MTNRTINLQRMKIIKCSFQFDFVNFINTCGYFCIWTTLFRHTFLIGKKCVTLAL